MFFLLLCLFPGTTYPSCCLHDPQQTWMHAIFVTFFIVTNYLKDYRRTVMNESLQLSNRANRDVIVYISTYKEGSTKIVPSIYIVTEAAFQHTTQNITYDGFLIVQNQQVLLYPHHQHSELEDFRMN